VALGHKGVANSQRLVRHPQQYVPYLKTSKQFTLSRLREYTVVAR